MVKPTIHFVFTVPLGSNILRRGIDKVIRMAHITPLHRWALDTLIPWQRPIRSVHAISYNLLRAFKRKAYPIKFYSIYEHTVCRMTPGDIFIGQPFPDGGFNSSRPDTDDRLSVTSRTVRENSEKNCFLIMPYTHDPLYVSWVKDLLREPIEGLILIGGDIWRRDWQKSPFYDLPIKRKVHVAMGIDTGDYPSVKKSFNPKGRRKYLYIGHTAWYKNTKELENIAARMPNFQGGHIGGGEIKGWKKIANFASLTPTFMSKLAEEYDIFVNTSTADAQATTILEQMCFGFVVACTPESGYDYPSLVRLSTTDTDYNVKELEQLQYQDEGTLLDLTTQNLAIAKQNHSWNKFCSTIIDFMNL